MDKRTGLLIGLGSAAFLILRGIVAQPYATTLGIVATVIGGLIGGALIAFIAVFLYKQMNKVKKE